MAVEPLEEVALWSFEAHPLVVVPPQILRVAVALVLDLEPAALVERARTCSGRPRSDAKASRSSVALRL